MAREANDIARADKAQAARPIEQFQKLQEKQRTMAMQAELTSSLIEKVPRSFLLAEMTNSLPTGVSLVDLVLDSRKKVVAPPAAPKSCSRRSGRWRGVKPRRPGPPITYA